MFIDTHCHLNFSAFKEDRDRIIKEALEKGMQIIMPSTQYSTSKRAVEIAERYSEGVYAGIGLHPIHVDARTVDVQEVESEEKEGQPWMTFDTRGEEFDYQVYKDLVASKKVVAVGECGLDYYYQPKGSQKRIEFQARQKAVFEQHINLSLEQDLPLIIHCRKAHDDLLEMLERYRGKVRGVVHCYTGSQEQALKFLDFGFYFGFNGLIFKKVLALPSPEEVIASLPLDRILLETDAPYLSPPQAHTERNEPLFVRYVAEEIARIKKLPVEEVSRVTTANARTLFALPS
ncbi:MAG: TatD family hydrolase [bacterium]|nr:TatD family hydrolase [bacterium]